MNDKPQKIELNNLTELSKVKESNYIVNIFNHPKRSNSSKDLINDEEDELLYTIKFDKETNKPIVSLIHSTGKSDTALIPTLKCLIVPNRDNMDKPKIIINSHSKEEQFKLILDTGSNVSLINKRLISKEMENHVHKTKAKINFPLLDVKEDTYKINYQQSNQLHCNVKAPRKHVTLSNDNQSDPHSILDDDDDIKEQVAKFVESIPSQLCDILAKTNPEEEEIQVLRDFINDSFEDIIVDKLPDIPDQINNSRRGNIIHNIIIKKDQDVEPTKKQIYYSTDEHKRHVEEMVLKFIDLGIIKRSESNYSSPIMLLKKRDSVRVVHDYRQLNKVTVRDDHPFPPVDSLLNQCKDSKLFSKFDIIMGYFQVLINPEHAKYTAFITHIGKFEYTRRPQVYYNTLMIYQIQGDKFKVIWFHSRKLTDTQKRYSIGDREFLSIIDSLKKFQHLLIGKKVTIYTDHQNLTFFINNEDGFKKLIIIDKETIHTIIREYHDTKYSGHHALDITYNNIRQDYYFKEMFSIIKRYIKSCAICQLNINRKDNGILQSLEIPFEVWRDISIDFLSLPKTTYALNGFTVEVDQVCVIVCRLSKMVHIVPCHKTIDAEHTAQLLLNHVFRLHGYPRTIFSDRDPRFLSDLWSRWAKTMDSKLKMTVAHRAQADGQTERMNREIIRILTKASTEYGENWSYIIPLIEFAMNSSMSKSTKMSPFQIVYGFNPPTPVNHFNSLTKTRIPMSNIKKIVRDNILDAQINAQKYYNRGRGDVIFVVGEKVMVKRKFFQTNLSKDLISHKLESKNCGPFIITAIHGNNVTLDLVGYPKKHNVFNKDQIVKLYEDTEWLREEISMPEPEEMDEASFEVESILNHDKVKKMYLVKFKGYPEPEWIKEVDTDCEELKKQLNSRRERENATIEAVEPIVSSPLSQEVQSSQQSKSRNQNTSSDDELDLSLQITTTRSGRKVTPKRL
ncbi:hypothetical protein ACTFIY_001261 [Dictyostelium cf. discoideum]